MKTNIYKGIIWVALAAMAVALFGCKGMDSESGSTTVSIDISGLTSGLATQSSSEEPANTGQVASPEDSDAQTTVKTLMVVPLTYAKHGRPYDIDQFDEEADEDFQNDAVNSANFFKIIQLPTSSSTVSIEVPSISEGWQLLAAATVEKVDTVEDIDGSTIAYLGFTEAAFKTADAFNKANVTLTLKRYCDQDEDKQPKGCATFDGEKLPIVTAAVEILKLEINGEDAGNGGNSFPWIVRAVPVSANNEISPVVAQGRLTAMVDAYVGEIETLTIHAAHQKSGLQPTTCKNLTSSSSFDDFETHCGIQTYTRPY